MNEQELWSVMHLNVGGVALEDGTPLDVLDYAMMVGTFAQAYSPIILPTPLLKNILRTDAGGRSVRTVPGGNSVRTV